MTAQFAFLDQPTPLAFAHRGGAADGLENSMVAFSRAVDLGYRYLETDVHATSDGVLVAFHDTTLDRTTDRTGAVATSTFTEVSRARIGGLEPIPLLEDLLMTWPDMRFNLDVKAPAAVEPLARLLRRLRVTDRVCIGSFSERRLAAIRRLLGPDVCTSLGPRDAARLRASVRVGGHGAHGLARYPCVQVPPRMGRVTVVTEPFVALVHRLGMQLHVWTIDDPGEMHRLLDLGVDGIMTDTIAVLREVLTARGQW